MPLAFPTDTMSALFLVSYAAAGVLSTVLVVYLVRSRWDRRAARAFVFVPAVTAVWSFGYVGRLLSPELPTKLFWTQVAWLGVTTVSVAMLAFVLIFTGRSRLVTRRSIGALLAIPVCTQVLLLTNDRHHLVYEEIRLFTDLSVPIFYAEGGLWYYWVHVPYSWGLYFVATALVLQFTLATTQMYRSQVLVALFGISFPWVANVAYMLGFRFHPALDPTPVGIAIGMATFGIAVFRMGFLGIVPVAREQVVDEVEECIVVLDDTDRIVDVNDAGGSFLSAVNADEWSIGTPASEALPPELARSTVLEEDHRWEAELLVEVDGEEVWYLVRTHDIGEGRYPGRIVTLTDITAQKTQQTLLEQQNAQLEQVASTVSHDLRNPLNVATGFHQLVEKRLADIELTDDERAELESLLARIDRSHERMEEIIQDVLTLARTRTQLTETERIEVDALAREAWECVQTNDLELVVEGSMSITVDPRRLSQLFENLYRNARSHGDGATTVAVGVFEDGFYVEDDGTGIPERERDRIFDLGVTTATNGTGLGLAIVRSVAEAHGWSVHVTEGRDGGARFEFSGVDAGGE